MLTFLAFHFLFLFGSAFPFLFTGELPSEEKTNICNDDICVIQFNAGFNSANEVKWLNNLTAIDHAILLILFINKISLYLFS